MLSNLPENKLHPLINFTEMKSGKYIFIYNEVYIIIILHHCNILGDT